MTADRADAWVYESLVDAIPGADLSVRYSIGLQILAFEAAVLAVAARYGLWSAVPAATVAVAVAGVGSWFMLSISRRIREIDAPAAYTRLLFGSSVEVALSVLAFACFVTYLFVVDPRASESPLLTALLGTDPPAVAVVLLLLVSWDLVYRIGTCWWASVVALWRASRYAFDPATTRRYARIDGRYVVFAAVQLSLVPFVAEQIVLAVALIGHVLAVVVVSVAAIVLQRRRATPSQGAT